MFAKRGVECRFAIAIAMIANSSVAAFSADITPPTEQRPPRGVAEFAEEFAENEKGVEPLIERMHPFTQYIASRRTRISREQYEILASRGTTLHAWKKQQPKVYLEDEDEIKVREYDFMKLAETGAASGRIVVPAHGPAPVELDFLAPPVFDNNDRRFDDPTRRPPLPSTEPPMRNWTIAMRRGK